MPSLSEHLSQWVSTSRLNISRSLLNLTPNLQKQANVCVFITAVPITKLFAWGEGDSGGHVLRETTSRGLSGLVCPSRTSERGGEVTRPRSGGWRCRWPSHVTPKCLAGERGALHCRWNVIAKLPIGLVPFEARGILPVTQEQSRPQRPKRPR